MSSHFVSKLRYASDLSLFVFMRERKITARSSMLRVPPMSPVKSVNALFIKKQVAVIFKKEVDYLTCTLVK